MNHFLRILCSVFLLVLFKFTFGQLPPNQPEQDCIGAIPICGDVYFQPNSYRGEGENSDEINGANSCLLTGEQNSVWYTFRVQNSGLLCFTISPVDTLDDYDWAVYNITNQGCGAIYNNPALEVACNFTFNTGCAGETGPNGRTDCAGQFEPCMPVNAGDIYAIMVSNFTHTNSGYTINFNQSSARLYDDIRPKMIGMTSFCHGVTVEFDENIQCASVDSLDFVFSGPDGPYFISEVRSVNCDAGGGFDRFFDLVVSPPIKQAGFYTLDLGGSVVDGCGNPAELKVDNIFMPLPPTADFNDNPPGCQGYDEFGFGYTGPSAVSGYFWDFGDGNTSRLPAPVHTYNTAGVMNVELVIIDVNGCPDTARKDLLVHPRPDARFTAPATICQGDTAELTNFTTTPDAILTDLTWYIGDGTVTQDENLNHPFPEAGIYQVLMEAFNDRGCRDTTSRMITVYPDADIDFAIEDNVCMGDSAHLLYLSTIRKDIANDEIVGWEWKFGDGNSVSDVVAPVHLYDTAGVYPVALVVTTDKGCVDSLIKEQEIHKPLPPDMVDDPVCFSEIAYLQAVPEDGGITRWFNNENDSLPFQIGAVFATPPVAYQQDYFVEVLSKEGCLGDRYPISAKLHDIGNAGIVTGDTLIEFPNPIVNFSVSGSITGESYMWNFGDDNTSTDEAPVHEYKYPGAYEVVVIITDINGCTYEFTRTLEVRNNVGMRIPSAFTPNGDGFNDEWYISHRLLNQFSISVYNRFGEEIFQSDNPDFRWNGYSQGGQALMEGVYVFRIRGLDNLGNSVDEQGTVTLLR